MLIHFAPLLKTCWLFLLSLDSKCRVFLSKICWFVPIAGLEEDESTFSHYSDTDFSVNWSELWDSAHKLYVSMYSPVPEKVENKSHTEQLTSFGTRKRYELLFLLLVSSLRQLIVCGHSSVEPSNISQSSRLPLKAQCAISPLCFFIT